ncbi:MAG: exosortase system-associated protein, TIGR04073 family [Nitrospiria bacterium]
MKKLFSNTVVWTMEAESGLATYSDNPAILKSMFLVLVISFALVLPSMSLANAPLDQYVEDTGTKLTTGVVNMSTGWAEIFSKPQDIEVKDGPIEVVSFGPLVGILKTALRTGSGVYDAVTFLFPILSKNQTRIGSGFAWQDMGSGYEKFRNQPVVENDPLALTEARIFPFKD